MTGGIQGERPELSAYTDFDRAEWSALRAATPLTLTEADVEALRGLNEPFELSEVEDVYLPLTRLLNLRFAATRDLRVVTETFLGHLHARVPYVIGIGGSVAAGKSTIKLRPRDAAGITDAEFQYLIRAALVAGAGH